jgi:hypothetical protein
MDLAEGGGFLNLTVVAKGVNFYLTGGDRYAK